MVKVGKPIANFTLPATGDKDLSLSDFDGTHLVLYFYPKDNTPGCCLLYTSPSPRDATLSRMPSSA